MATSDTLTLRQAYQAFQGDQQCDIPFMVWLFENPDSPLPMPGRIYLREHDYLHILLDRGISPEDEAFVVGFTLGNALKVPGFYLPFFKFVARYLYPQPYRFQAKHLPIFDAGVRCGQQVQIKGLNHWNFDAYLDQPLQKLRAQIGIYLPGHSRSSSFYWAYAANLEELSYSSSSQPVEALVTSCELPHPQGDAACL